MKTQKAASKAPKSAPATKAKPSKLASIKNALMGMGAKKKAPTTTTKAPAAKGAGKAAPVAAAKAVAGKKGAPAANAKAAAPAAKAAAGKGATSAKGAAKVSAPAKAATPVAAPAEAPVKGKRGKVAPTAAQVRGKAASAALSSIALGKSGGKTVSASDGEVCREVACEGLSTSGGYCRLHYIKNWKKIQRKAGILREGKLTQYIDELVTKYPDKYIEAIRQDLASDKDFAKVIYDLDLDESVDEFVEGEGEGQADNIIDNIKREFDDEGETF